VILKFTSAKIFLTCKSFQPKLKAQTGEQPAIPIGGIKFMKKRVVTLSLAALSLLGLVGCNKTSATTAQGDVPAGQTTTATPDNSVATEKVKAAIKDAEGLSRADLMKKAVEELKAAGSGAGIKIEAVTSRGGKAAAKAEFARELQAAGMDYGITDTTSDDDAAKKAPVTYNSTVDGKIYTILSGEIESGVKGGYDGAILQDGYQLQKKFIDTGYFTNYVPKEWKEENGNVTDGSDDPFTLQYNFKTWMYNNKNGDVSIDNVWDITQDKFKGKVFTMDPSNENVNMDWLIMLTNDTNAAGLKAAFEASTNDNKSLDLTKYAQYGDTKKYAYAFIDKFIANSVFYADDGAAVDALAKTPGALGWIVYSKIQNIKESADTSKKNIVIAALGNEHTDGANPGESKMDGFGGFMYKHYMSIMPKTELPYTTAAFFNILATTKKGYKNWAGDVGDYPTMASVNADRTKNGHGTLTDDYKWTQNSTEANVFPCLNDPSATWWNDATKGEAVIETPSYIGPMYNRVGSFIQVAISQKK
jgi:hypothetical protein